RTARSREPQARTRTDRLGCAPAVAPCPPAATRLWAGDLPAPVRLRSVIVNAAGRPASSLCGPDDSQNPESARHTMTCTGWNATRAPTRPDTRVGIVLPSTRNSGPEPHGSENFALGDRVAGRSPPSAGMDSLESPTGRRAESPEIGCAVVAYWTTGKLIVIWLVRSGGT